MVCYDYLFQIQCTSDWHFHRHLRPFGGGDQRCEVRSYSNVDVHIYVLHNANHSPSIVVAKGMWMSMFSDCMYSTKLNWYLTFQPAQMLSQVLCRDRFRAYSHSHSVPHAGFWQDHFRWGIKKLCLRVCMYRSDRETSQAKYSNNWAEYLVQQIGPNGDVAILSLLWVDSTVSSTAKKKYRKRPYSR